MRRLVAFAALLLPALAAGAIYSTTKRETGMALTATAPSAAGDGVDISGVTGIRLIVSAPAGQTITGGFLDCFYRSPALARWTPWVQTAITLRTGERDAPSFDYPFEVSQGRFACRARGVTLSGAGTTVDVTYELSSRT